MRVALAAGVFASFALLPYLLRTSLLARGSPMVLAWVRRDVAPRDRGGIVRGPRRDGFAGASCLWRAHLLRTRSWPRR